MKEAAGRKLKVDDKVHIVVSSVTYYGTVYSQKEQELGIKWTNGNKSHLMHNCLHGIELGWPGR